ncbi:hypothetical protein K470DRAFT_271213 [Piedraia hortae CBS 480.64]|uniref:RING-type domain-containing protein n=1 Tax=Piedraia hortae CBS 480.64 TaxID=1314780 RepID=A0A6A7BWQ5_9PEZI|nr:hypothetical protein K470DRAFT_271213 [Piedraia hortae CBS 480.64]
MADYHPPPQGYSSWCTYWEEKYPEEHPFDVDMVPHFFDQLDPASMPAEAACPICMILYHETPGEAVVNLPCEVGHTVHWQCAFHWFNQSPTCPYDRKIVMNKGNFTLPMMEFNGYYQYDGNFYEHDDDNVEDESSDSEDCAEISIQADNDNAVDRDQDMSSDDDAATDPEVDEVYVAIRDNFPPPQENEVNGDQDYPDIGGLTYEGLRRLLNEARELFDSQNTWM